MNQEKRRLILGWAAPLVLAIAALAQTGDISGERMRAHVKFLSSDLLEGPRRRDTRREAGHRIHRLAVRDHRSQSPPAIMGLISSACPWWAPPPSRRQRCRPWALARLSPFKWLDDFVGVSELQQPADQFEAEAIFVGHGIVAPEFQWDDFKGVDVKGKVLVLFTNEPPSDDPKFFGGRALTYYGRWTYKYEEARAAWAPKRC